MSLLKRVHFVLGLRPVEAVWNWWPAGILGLLIPLGLFWYTPDAQTEAGEILPRHMAEEAQGGKDQAGEEEDPGQPGERRQTAEQVGSVRGPAHP